MENNLDTASELITELKFLRNMVCGTMNQIQELVHQYANVEEKDEGLYLDCVEAITIGLEIDVQRSVERIIADINNNQGTSQTSVQFQQFGENNIQLASVSKIVLKDDDGMIMEEW